MKSAAAASALAFAPRADGVHENAADELPPAFAGLKPLGARVRPIQTNEFRERLMHAQKLMSDLAPKYDALFFAPGTSLYYFTGFAGE